MAAGFIVLADRYIYTLMARDIVRGGDPQWLKRIYEQITLVPDAVFYMDIAPRFLIERNFQKTAELDYWESGMDARISRDIFDSFIKYQRKMKNVFKIINASVAPTTHPAPTVSSHMRLVHLGIQTT